MVGVEIHVNTPRLGVEVEGGIVSIEMQVPTFSRWINTSTLNDLEVLYDVNVQESIIRYGIPAVSGYPVARSNIMDKLDTPTSWQEAFESCKIPVIRTIEEQLRVGVSRDKERLRDLVGGNYRDLLSTADEIILLATRTRTVEGQISEIGQKCEPSQKHVQKRTLSLPARLAAQANCLSKCIIRGSSALRKGQTLLSAKLLVVSRLLIKSLAESDASLQVIEQLRGKGTLLRRQLLRRIDLELRNPRSATKSSVDAICAYCLITSSSSSDAVKHFQQIRLERLRQRLTSETHSVSYITETFQYLVSTIQSLQTLLGRAVNDPINNLQQHPILEDPSITQLESIGIDQARKLIPADITSFTPYIKRVLLRRDEIRSIVEGWTTEACEVFSKGLIEAFSKTKAVSEVTSLRKDLLSILLPVYFSTYAQQVLLSTIRQATSVRLHELNHRQVETLAKIGRDMTRSTSLQTSIISPWESSFIQTNLGTQSERYLHQLHDRHLGTKGDLDKNIRRLKAWARQSAQLQRHIHGLRSIRWQDVIEEADEEDEEDAATIISQLTNDDPQHLHDSIDQSLKAAVLEFEGVVRQTVNDALEPSYPDVQRVVYLIRLIRESAPAISGIVSDIQSRNLEHFAKLHQALTSEVIRKLSSEYDAESSPKITPEHLPQDLPSPLTISFLRNTCSIMSEIGGIDIWSQSASSLLKHALSEQIFAEEHKTAYMQTDFDAAYLQAAFKTDQFSGQDKSISNRAAAMYWNRTRLLFGILN